MKAYICDRCGETYLTNDRVPTSGRIRGSHLAGLDLMNRFKDIDRHIDLCDDCLEDFQDFMNKVAKEERTAPE